MLVWLLKSAVIATLNYQARDLQSRLLAIREEPWTN
jgi:hypothetical protein